MSETGTRDNLFFSCSISSYIWSLCKIKLGLRADHIGTLADERMIIQTRFKRKDKVAALARIVYRASVCHIWKERNAKVFQGISRHKIKGFRSLYGDVHSMLRFCNWPCTLSDFVLCNWGISVIVCGLQLLPRLLYGIQ